MYRPVALLLTLAALSPAISKAGGLSPASGGAAVSVTQRQIRLSLQLRAAAFPRNALVLATVRLTNQTGRPISTWDCLRSSLGAEVSRSGGVGTSYPPLLPPPGAPWSGCPGGMGMGGMGMRHMTWIPAGQTLTRMTYVVLRAFTVRAWAQLMVRTGQMKPALIQTPPLHIRETAGTGPSVHLQMGPSISARVTPVPGAGPILYSEYASCRDRAHATNPLQVAATYSQWARAPGAVLHPFGSPCTTLDEWMLFVAQPGRPIAQTYYCAQRNRCAYAYAPPTPQERGIAACKRDIGRALMAGRLPRAAARYAIGLSSVLPTGLTPTQQTLAQQFHARCAPLLARHAHAP